MPKDWDKSPSCKQPRKIKDYTLQYIPCDCGSTKVPLYATFSYCPDCGEEIQWTI